MVLSSMPQCVLGTNKLTRLRQFGTWLEETENPMKYIEVPEDYGDYRANEIVTFMKTPRQDLF